MAYCLDKTKKNEEVVQALRRLPESALTCPKVAFLLGCALASLGHKEEACKAFDRARLDTPEATYLRCCRQLKVMLELGF
jgi:hypothetical protein